MHTECLLRQQLHILFAPIDKKTTFFDNTVEQEGGAHIFRACITAGYPLIFHFTQAQRGIDGITDLQHFNTQKRTF